MPTVRALRGISWRPRGYPALALRRPMGALGCSRSTLGRPVRIPPWGLPCRGWPGRGLARPTPVASLAGRQQPPRALLWPPRPTPGRREFLRPQLRFQRRRGRWRGGRLRRRRGGWPRAARLGRDSVELSVSVRSRRPSCLPLRLGRPVACKRSPRSPRCLRMRPWPEERFCALLPTRV